MAGIASAADRGWTCERASEKASLLGCKNCLLAPQLAHTEASWQMHAIVCTLGVELLLCMLLGSTTFFTWFLITILKYVQLVNHDAYKEFLSSPWGIGLSRSPSKRCFSFAWRFAAG